MQNKQIQIWLIICAILVVAIVILGGYTRLSNAGLSIVEWRPISGIIPPLNEADWQTEFSQYKQSPEYQKINHGISITAFKQIFIVEYLHRVLGRIIGLTFLLPFLFFILRDLLSRDDIYYFGGIALLLGMQGVIGWFMVKSGLVDLPNVSQYRLALHLLMACLILILLLWKIAPPLETSQTISKKILNYSKFTFGLLLLQIASGAFVAGLDAGMTYNSFPLMDGELIPDGLMIMHPWYSNFFENTTTVQFIHRCLGILNLANILLYSHKIFDLKPCIIRKTSLLLAGFVALQFVLGIFTLILQVPLLMALLHQACAMILLIIMVVSLKQMHFRYCRTD